MKELQGGTITNDGTASWDGKGELKLDNKTGENGGKIENNGVFSFNGSTDEEISGRRPPTRTSKTTGQSTSPITQARNCDSSQTSRTTAT